MNMNRFIYWSRTPLEREPYAEPFVRTLLSLAKRRGCESVIVEHLTAKDLARRGGVVLFSGSMDAMWYTAQEYLAGGASRKVLWYQGIESEESYLKHHSRIKRAAIYVMERACFSLMDAIIVPSRAMRSYLEGRLAGTRGDTTTRIHVIPNLTDGPVQKEPDAWKLWGFVCRPAISFGYAGSLAPWQCAAEMAALATGIQRRIPDSVFLILTSDRERAQSLVNFYRIPRAVVRTAALSEVEAYVSAFDAGMMLRREHVVNYVSHPTKWLLYWKLGIPVMTTNAVEAVRVAGDPRDNLFLDITSGISDKQIECAVNWLKLLSDGGRREEIANRLQQEVKTYWTWEAWNDQIDAFFRSIGL